MIWFTLTDGNSIAVAPEHVRYILPTKGGETVICFSRRERFTVSQPPTEVAARLRRGDEAEEVSAAAPAPPAPRARAARSRPKGGSGGAR